MTYMFDTNIIIYCLKNSFPKIMEHLRHTSPNNILIPSIVVAELEFGSKNSVNYESNILKINSFLEPFSIVPFDSSCATYYGEIRHSLKMCGKPIGANDMLIAATALSHKSTLITNNTREFSRIEGLKICDWTK